MYTYRATLISVVDGDTAHVDVSLGCDVRINLTLRLAGINCPEMRSVSGPLAREFLVSLLPAEPDVLVVRTSKDHREKYGRYLAWLILPDGRCVNRLLVDAGHAAPYGNLPVDPPA